VTSLEGVSDVAETVIVVVSQQRVLTVIVVIVIVVIIVLVVKVVLLAPSTSHPTRQHTPMTRRVHRQHLSNLALAQTGRVRIRLGYVRQVDASVL
jgi:hypothetical protein